MNTVGKRKSYIFDLILIVSLLLLCLSAFLFFFSNESTDSAVAVVYIENEIVGEYRLDKNGEYEINGGTNILKIEDGKAYMLYASCPDGWCKNQGQVYITGERITCLPNRVMIVVRGADGEK